jgi:hypothetical protein
MIWLVWRALWVWRLWRAINRNGHAQRLVRRGWELHRKRWAPDPKADTGHGPRVDS